MKRLVLFLAICTLVFPGCGELFDPAAAAVGGEKITSEEVQRGVDAFKGTEKFKQLAGQGDVEAVTRQFEQGFLATLVRRAVLQPKADELGIEVTDQDVDDQLASIKADFPNDQAYQEALEEQALDEAQLRELVSDRLLEDALRAEVTADVGPPDEELQAYYEENIDLYTFNRAQHILVKEPALARVISAELQRVPEKNIEKDFARLAKKHSTDAQNKGKGGDLGEQPGGTFVPEFEAALADLDEGEISEPVKTEFGFHIIRLISRRTAPFAEVAPEISEELAEPAKQEAFMRWLEEAYEDADVRINPRFGELDVATGQIVDATADDVPGAEAPKAPPSPTVPVDIPQPSQP
ncbi:MAG: peptidyl-prolyl cis-trans isomerase [Actinobacteria bacterium]|nr:peptidyl-prolyl cis-trans isomerase [Actinomycetota bacterium]